MKPAMSSTTEVLYRAARPQDLLHMFPERNQNLPISLASFEDRDMVEINKTEVPGVSSGIVLRKRFIDSGKDMWLHSVPSFDNLKMGQKFLLDKATADSIPWLAKCIKQKDNVDFYLQGNKLVVFQIFTVYKIAAGTTIKFPYVLDNEINPDGHVIIRTEDLNVDFETPMEIETQHSNKHFSPTLAKDLSQAELCGVLLIVSEKVGRIRPWTKEKVCEMDTPCEAVQELSEAVASELGHCFLEDYELLTGWLAKAERANFALSCVHAQ